jgi:hypothetical protein
MVLFCLRHKKTLTAKENIAAKAQRTPREDGRRNRGEGSKTRDSHYCFFEKIRKNKKPHCLANVGHGLVVRVTAGASGKKAFKAERVFL